MVRRREVHPNYPPWKYSTASEIGPGCRVTPNAGSVDFSRNAKWRQADPLGCASNGGEMATVYVGDLVEIDFADGQPMLSSLRSPCFDELDGIRTTAARLRMDPCSTRP
jgi:hypothetical protein